MDRLVNMSCGKAQINNSSFKKSVNYFIGLDDVVVLLFLVSLMSISVPYGFPLFGPLTLFFSIAFILFSRGITLAINKVVIFYFLCSFIYMLSIFINSDVMSPVVFTDTMNILESMAVYYLISQINIPNYDGFLSKLFKAAFILACVISFFSIYKYVALLNGIRLPAVDVYSRYPIGSSLVRDYNSFALVLNIGLFSSLNIFKKKLRLSRRILIGLGIILISLSVVLSMSRRGWVTLLIFYIIIFVRVFNTIRFKTKIVPHKFFLIILCALIILVFLFSIFVELPELIDPSYLLKRLSTLRLDNVVESMAPRTDRINFGLNLYLERPVIQKIFGGGFSYIFDYGDYTSSSNSMDYPHNHLVSALLYSGIIGAIILSMFIIILFRWVIVRRNNINKELILLFFISSVVMSISSNSIFSNMPFIFIMLLTMCYPVKSRQHRLLEIKYRK